MHWVLILTMSIVLGWLASVFLRRFGLTALVCVPIAILGAVLGGVLDRISLAGAYGLGSFYGLAFLMCLFLLVGAAGWCYFIVGSERRV